MFPDGQNNNRDDSESAQGWKSQTDDSTLSQDLSSLDLEGSERLHGADTDRKYSPQNSYTSELDGLDLETKEATLIGIFPTLKPFDIKWTLKKYKGDASLAIDELMTQSFLEESGGRHRGVEAFSDNDSTSRRRKGKGKGKNKRGMRDDDQPASPSVGAPMQSKWDTGKNDIELIATNTGMPLHQVTTMYHKNGASLHNTISAIIEAYAAVRLEADDHMVQINAFELQQDFPSLSMADLEGIVLITQPYISKARDLAQAYSKRSSPRIGGVLFDFRHAPIETPSEPKTRPGTHNAVYPDLPLDASTAAHVASTHRNARDTAFAQASSAYRKGKSDHLMGGAAAYYSQVGRDINVRLKAAESREADALVASQSEKLKLDLHGVTVKDAVRIARDGVDAWWYALGEDRLRGSRGVGPGYRIVTGVGIHSEGGRGKIGPAVGKMLLAEGWKVVVGTGHFLVTGKRH